MARTGCVVEYRGSAVEALSIEERMTVCNMSIEAGARAGMVAADQKTIDYLRGRKYAPKGAEFEKAAEKWLEFKSDDGAKFDRALRMDAAEIAPQVTWGTNPGMVIEVTGKVPDPAAMKDEGSRKSAEAALEYMALKPGTRIEDIKIDRVFIGSCTNSRISDLTNAANVIKGRKVAKNVQAMVVPGSQHVKLEAEKLGLDKIFTDAGLRMARVRMQHVPRHESRHP